MSSSRNSLKRRHNEVASLDEPEEKVAPTSNTPPENTTRNVMQRLASQAELDDAARSTGAFRFHVSNAFTVLESFKVPLTFPIVNLVRYSPEAALSICESLVDLQDANIEMTDAIVKSMVNPDRKIIVSHLRELHAVNIQLRDIIVQGLTLAFRLSFQKEYFIAIQLLYINHLLCDESIQKLNKYLQRVNKAIIRFEEADSNEDIYTSDDESFEDEEVLVDVAKRIMSQIEAENRLLTQRFDDFLNNPEESHVLPIPAELGRIVHSFFSTPLIDAEADLRDAYEKRLTM